MTGFVTLPNTLAGTLSGRRWSFGVEIGEYRGVVRVPRRVFQRLLPGGHTSLSLARAGLQPLYDRYRIEAIMMRLRTWMCDAMTGGLIADGWEPVPFTAAMPVRGGLFDPAAFQEIAAKRRVEPGWTTGLARITLPDKGNYVVIEPVEFDAIKPAGYSALSRAAERTVAESLSGRGAMALHLAC